MKIYLQIFLSLLVYSNCSAKQLPVNEFGGDSIPTIRFCDLPKYKNQLVHIKCKYSGYEEYWSLKNEKIKCDSALRIELEFKDERDVPKEYEKIFEEVYNNYWKSFLVIEAIGIFENDRKTGYGHLGTNNGRFIVSKIIEITLVKKQKRRSSF